MYGMGCDCTEVHLLTWQHLQRHRQVSVMELPCIAHTLAEGHPSLAGALETGGFDYVVITSPEVRPYFVFMSYNMRDG